MDTLVEARLSGGFSPDTDWLADISFKIPRKFLENAARILPPAGNIELEWAEGKCHFDPDSLGEEEKKLIVAAIRSERMYIESPPLSSKMPFSYQMIPPFARSIIARAIGRKKRRDVHKWAAFPSFPLDLSCDAISDIFSLNYSKLRPTPVLLTHDIDSPEGLENLPLFLEAEEEAGARSTNFVVPCGWEIDHGLLSEVKLRNHEIGVHGFDHSNRTAFMDAASIRSRMEKMREFIDRYDVAGYRAPSLLRTPVLLNAVSKVFQYDSSIPTSGGLFPVPNNGCASARVFEVGGICEIPLSMPRDGTLLFLGFSPEHINKLWIECADRISRSGGVVVLLTHCERRFSGGAKMLGIYRQILQHFRNSHSFTFLTCRDMVASKKDTP